MIKWNINENEEQYLKTRNDQYVLKANFEKIFGQKNTYEELINTVDDEGWIDVINDWKQKGILN